MWQQYYKILLVLSVMEGITFKMSISFGSGFHLINGRHNSNVFLK